MFRSGQILEKSRNCSILVSNYFQYSFIYMIFFLLKFKKHNDKICNSLSNICRISNKFRIYKKIKRKSDRIGSDVGRSFSSLRSYCYLHQQLLVALLSVTISGSPCFGLSFPPYPVEYCFLLFYICWVKQECAYDILCFLVIWPL